MSGMFGVLGILLLCWLLLPMSGWWLARLLRQDGFLRFAAACLTGAATLAAAELLVYVFRLPQWLAAALVGVTVAVSVRDLIATIRRGEFAWGALLT